MKFSLLAAVALIVLSVGRSPAEELNIGHIETSDDSASDGSQVMSLDYFFRCDPHQRQNCTVMQYHEIKPKTDEVKQKDVTGRCDRQLQGYVKEGCIATR